MAGGDQLVAPPIPNPYVPATALVVGSTGQECEWCWRKAAVAVGQIHAVQARVEAASGAQLCGSGAGSEAVASIAAPTTGTGLGLPPASVTGLTCARPRPLLRDHRGRAANGPDVRRQAGVLGPPTRAGQPTRAGARRTAGWTR